MHELWRKQLRVGIPSALGGGCVFTSSVFACVDSHTAGEPTRLVIGGVPFLSGRDIIEKTGFLAENMDYIRTTLTREPRGHAPVHATVVTPPSGEEADFGLIFMSALGYLRMCGHALIGAVTSLLELGIVAAREPETKLSVETLAGNIAVRARVSQGRVESVTFRNQPAFVYKSDVEVNVGSIGKLSVDIAYGGLWYAIVEARKVGLEIGLHNLEGLVRLAALIREAVNARVSAVHPQTGALESIPQVLFVGPPVHPEADGRNFVTSRELGFDRSPCGTGSCAKMALLHARGELHLGQDYVHESIIGTLFRGRLVEETKVGSIHAVVPEITGSAYITGINHVVIDPRDPLKHGFCV